MKYRVWIAKDMNSIMEDNPLCREYAFFSDVDNESLSLLLDFMRREGCAIAIMPALSDSPESAPEGETDA